jgi:hypothetical protein
MFRLQKKIICSLIGAVSLIGLGTYSYYWPMTLRWTHHEPLSAQEIINAPPGRPVAETLEIGVIDGRLRWMENDWLATPHVATGEIAGVPKKNGLSVSLRDTQAFGVDEGDLDWHFAGFSAGHPVFFQDDGTTADEEAQGLWEINSREICVPLWIFALPLVIPWLPALWRGKRERGGQYCPQCGYDLRATPERCPECGRIPNNISAIMK